jgi:hypothetical protein
MSGWACSPNSGLTVSLGGDGTTRDVAVAEDNAGNKTTVNNISGSPVDVTISAAPGANSRIDAIVAYVDNPPQGSSTIADNYEACGLIAVDGVAAASPVAPNDSAIRSAITADGASGTTAYYVVLATVTIASGTTDITDDNIMSGDNSTVLPGNLMRWVPDYANRGSTNILPGSNTNFTISDTGFLDFQEIYKYSGGSDTYLRVTINRQDIIRMVAPPNSTTQYSGILPVVKGDVVSVTYNTDAGAHHVYFIPGRWV